MDTEGKKLGKSEYIAFLAKFPKETFNLKKVNILIVDNLNSIIFHLLI